jgi:hypothetical protein
MAAVVLAGVGSELTTAHDGLCHSKPLITAAVPSNLLMIGRAVAITPVTLLPIPRLIAASGSAITRDVTSGRYSGFDEMVLTTHPLQVKGRQQPRYWLVMRSLLSEGRLPVGRNGRLGRYLGESPPRPMKRAWIVPLAVRAYAARQPLGASAMIRRIGTTPGINSL